MYACVLAPGNVWCMPVPTCARACVHVCMGEREGERERMCVCLCCARMSVVVSTVSNSSPPAIISITRYVQPCASIVQ